MCGFGWKRDGYTYESYNFGTHYDLDFTPAPEHELIDANWDIDNWINGDDYDGCAAFQQVLDGKSLEPSYSRVPI